MGWDLLLETSLRIRLSQKGYIYSWQYREQKGVYHKYSSEKYVKEADYFGIASGRDAEKFSVSGLTSVKSSVVDAPYVDEFLLVLECNVLRIVELGLHTQFVGEIMDVKADPSVLTENGVPDIAKVKPVIFEPGNRRYYRLGSCLGQAFSIGKELQSNQL